MNIRPKHIQALSKFCLSNWPTLSKYGCPTTAIGQLKQHQMGLSVDQHKFYSRQAEKDSIRKFNFMKKTFGLSLFGSTLLVVWIFKRKKLVGLREKLEECVKIPLNEELFKSKVSLYRYRGFIFPGDIILSGVMQELPKFNFREEDVVVASFPKAGTTWVQEIVYMLTHNFERSNDSSEVLETRFPYLEYPYPGIKSISKREGRRLIKTHLPATILPDSFKFSGAKLIYIMRNPKDTAVSYWHFMKLLSTVNFTGSFNEFVQLFLSDKVPYGPFYDHLRSYSNLQKTQDILIITYENLKENPLEVIKTIAEYLQIPLSEEHAREVAVATCFKAMAENKSVNYEHWKDLGFANKNGKFMRKGQVGDWKSYFTPTMLEDFEAWRIQEDYDEQYKFKFEFNYKSNVPIEI